MMCQGNPELVSAFIDGELSDQEAAKVAKHIENCPACGRLRDEYILIGQLVAGEETQVPEGFAAAVMGKISTNKAAQRKRRIRRYSALAAVCAIVIVTGAALGVFNGRLGINKTGSTADSAAMETYDTAASDEQAKFMLDSGSEEFGYADSSEAAGDVGDASGSEQSYGCAGSVDGADDLRGGSLGTSQMVVPSIDGETPDGGEPNADQAMDEFTQESSGADSAQEAAATDDYRLSVQVNNLDQVVQAMKNAGNDYYVFLSDDGTNNLVISLADYNAMVSATSNVLVVETDSDDGQWVLLSEN